ncbi:hypothetical protein [Shimia biformata]|uniref:capsular polysaccharide export protein, LipB/KpsS family n=1 Tax=Shimia biformata TaxID=1294299 RepID=UPI00194EF21B|nr:hypothetical protein [Shimia biformata]
MTDKEGVVLHLPAEWLTGDGEGPMPFYQRLQDGFRQLGIASEVVPINRGTLAEQVEADRRFHILNHARHEHPRVLTAGVAYIYPFWNLDPKGIRAFSSIADKRFRPGTIDADKAKRFYKRLRQRWVDRRESRYEQSELRTEIPEGCVAVFFQSEANRDVAETCYLDRWQMLDTVLATVDGPVVVKPHPRDLDEDMIDRLLALHAAHPNLVISQANIHDILAVAKRVVTINSAVGIEAFLHRKPVILCGQSDFHHIADVARTPDELATLLTSEPRGRVYAKFLYWYFAQNCINAGRDDMAREVARRIQATGYDLGL